MHMSDTPPPPANPEQEDLDIFMAAAFGAYARSRQAEQDAYYESSSEAEYKEKLAASEAEFIAAIKKTETDDAATAQPTPPQDTK
jgi:hypothetical protein